ncbi:BON domain-containing protein [Cupriavidus sp. AU9028]|uniref:BON domain-containing protein n=1 Tax=Cupriavidus sp. AU9028 TaxID=2871157 RepID=UPI001C94ED70|nr:BON domain-containing protein [Cupriavidus sp. AU9028]MBY4896983.1 BON domain-containing protein [Cupriavidus sp. AU9028]
MDRRHPEHRERQQRQVRAVELSEDREGQGYFPTGMEWFPEDAETGEVAETWRNRGYGAARNIDHDYHYRRGDIGGQGYGGGGMGFGEPGNEPLGRQYDDAHRPRARVAPKGYRRTDERICDEVCERLAHARGLDVSEVTVDVGSAIVTLGGTIRDRQAKYRVEEIAAEVAGVDEVINNIRVPR